MSTEPMWSTTSGALTRSASLEGLERVPEGVLALPRIVGGELEDVRRRAVHAHGQRTEVVQAGDLDLARVHGLEDAGQQADADAVAQLGVLEAQIADLAQHRAAIRVAMRIPAGGK